VVFETERKQLQGFQNIVIWQRYLKWENQVWLCFCLNDLPSFWVGYSKLEPYVCWVGISKGIWQINVQLILFHFLKIDISQISKVGKTNYYIPYV
jgi:hypothetical protein